MSTLFSLTKRWPEKKPQLTIQMKHALIFKSRPEMKKILKFLRNIYLNRFSAAAYGYVYEYKS